MRHGNSDSDVFRTPRGSGPLLTPSLMAYSQSQALSNETQNDTPKISELSLDDQSVPQAGSSTSADADEGAYDDGDLPDFSDDESRSTPASSSSTARLPPPRPKGPPGRKKVPGAAAIKKKIQSVVPQKDAKDKQKAQAAPSDVPAPGGIKLSDSQIDALMQHLVSESPEMRGKLTREDVQNFVNVAGINKAFLQGKQGLMGKGAKDMGQVHAVALEYFPR